MSLDGFLTFLTLMVALYAIAPSTTRLALRVRSRWALTLAVSAFALTTYLMFFEHLGLKCPNHVEDSCALFVIDPPRTLSAREWAYFVVLAWLGLTAWMMLRAPTSPQALPTLARLVAELADERRFAELIKFVEPALPMVERAAKRKLPGQVFYDTLLARHPSKAPISLLIEQMKTGEEPSPKPVQAALSRVLLPLVQSGANSETAATEILRRLLHDREFREYLGRFRPDFAVRLLAVDVHGVHDFFAAYMGELISTPSTSLYQELEENQNIGLRGYQFPERNKLLHYLFDDARNAERLAAWQPIGEYALSNLREENNTYASYLNSSASHFEAEQWRDVTFVSIRFFDLMVLAALFQGIRWHMWLYYMQCLHERLIAQYDATGEGVDAHDEWPTRRSALLYQLYKALTGWFEASRDLKAGEPHLAVEGSGAHHENDNIPKSAALCLGLCLRQLLRTDRVPLKFRKYLVDVAFNRIARLPEDDDHIAVRRAVISAVVAGGVLGPDVAYGNELKRMFAAAGASIREDLEDFEEELGRVYP